MSNIKITLRDHKNEDHAIKHTVFKFSGGEVHVKVDHVFSGESIEILAHIKSSDDLMELLLVTNALRDMLDSNTKICLVMPYIPYARQDRACEFGEALSIKVFANIINSQNYDEVWVTDPHSDVATALLNNCVVVNQSDEITNLFIDWDNAVIVSPDAGANKKTFKVARVLHVDTVVRADKVRDTKTGEITGTVVYSDYIGKKDFVIVDDICDGGRTFIELAKVLRPLTSGKIILYVTHGIFSKGLDVFRGVIDEVYCAYPFDDKLEPHYDLLSKKEEST